MPFPCVVPILGQAEFVFEHGAQLGADSIIGFRVMDSQFFGMNLVALRYSLLITWLGKFGAV
jgi:hypothetical protein